MKTCAQLETRGAGRQLEVHSDFSAKVLAATAQTVHGRRSDAKVIAEILGLKPRAIYAIAAGEMPLKVAHVPAMVNVTGCYAIPDLLEETLGRVAFALPPVNPPVEEMNRELARTVQQFGAFLERNGVALADGRIEPCEIGPLLKSLDAMLAGLSEYRAIVVRKAEQDVAA